MAVARRVSRCGFLVVLLALIGTLLAAGCGHQRTRSEHHGRPILTLTSAAEIVANFERSLVPTRARLAPPASDEDILAVLKADRLDAFADAIAFLKGRDDVEGLAFRAQLLLAEAEAELVLAELLARTAARLDDASSVMMVRSATSPLNAAEREQLVSLQEQVQHYRETDEALRLLAVEHVSKGHRAAEKLMEAHPDSYLGYRIAADAARLRNQWPRFEEYVRLVEARNPESNGLRFLRGTQAWGQNGDAVAAGAFFREALAHDGEFVRAQAQLVLVTVSLKEQHEALQALRRLSPDHQVVRWAGPGIEAAVAALIDNSALPAE